MTNPPDDQFLNSLQERKNEKIIYETYVDMYIHMDPFPDYDFKVFGNAQLSWLLGVLVRPGRFGPRDYPHSQRGGPREDEWFYDLRKTWKPEFIKTQQDKNDLRDLKQLVHKLLTYESFNVLSIGDYYHTMYNLCHFHGFMDLILHFGSTKINECRKCAKNPSHWRTNPSLLDKLLGCVQQIRELAPKLLEFSEKNIRVLQLLKIYVDDLEKSNPVERSYVLRLFDILIAFGYLKQYNPHYFYAREQAIRMRTYFLIGLDMPISVVESVEWAFGWMLVARASKTWAYSTEFKV